MTISSTNRKAGPYVGNDTATDFPFNFKVFSASDALVVRADSAGAETALTLDTDYTVALNANQDSNPGGTITLPAALATGYTLVIASKLENLQPADLTNNGGFYPKVINNALDRLTILVQQLAESVARSLKVAITTPDGVDSQLPAPVPYALLGWNEDGTGFRNSDPSGAAGLVPDLASTEVGKGASRVAINDAGGYYTGETVEAALQEAAGYQGAGAGSVPRTKAGKLSDVVNTADYSTVAQAVSAAFASRTPLIVRNGETAKLACNPTAGDDLQAMALWASAPHYVQEGAAFYLEIADGLHDVSTYIDITEDRLLDMRATASPDLLTITGVTFVNAGEVGAPAGELYTATVTVLSVLPDRVVAGFAVGGLNVHGDGGADAINCGMIVDSVAGDRLSFTTTIRSHGVALTNPTALDGTPSLGLTPNQLVVPKCTIRCNEAGWDGAAREGFMNALRGGRIHLYYVGISYNGIAGDNDILFASGDGSEIKLADYCVIAGAGEMVTRAFDNANISTNRSCLGGASMGIECFQGSGGGSGSFTRTMMGSVSGTAVTASSGSNVQIGNSVVSGANICLRTTNPDASIIATSTRVSRAAAGVTSTKGDISIDSASSIRFCTSSISLAGGFVHGNPTISDNTNAAPTANSASANGGGWHQTNTKLTDLTFYKVGRFSGALDFPSIAANSFADLTIAAAGAAFDDFCIVQRAGAAEPAQGIVFRAFVSAADVVTVRAYNITTGAIDPTAFTGRVLVMRAT